MIVKCELGTYILDPIGRIYDENYTLIDNKDEVIKIMASILAECNKAYSARIEPIKKYLDEAAPLLIKSIDDIVLNRCIVCGGDIIGDGHTLARHCENVDLPVDRECDAPTLYCEESK